MKRKVLSIFCAVMALCLLSGCSSPSGDENSSNSSNKPALENVIDYSVLGDPYNTILAFAANPADYQGQNIKINALSSVVYNFDQNKVVKHIMLGLDPTGCCNAYYEVRNPDGTYPVNGSTTTFIGTFTSDGYVDLYDSISNGKEATYDLDTLTMSADELNAFITEYTGNYENSASAGKKIRIFGHLANQSGYMYLLGLNGDGYEIWYIELHEPTGSLTFPTVSGNIVNPVEIIGTLSFYYEGDIAYPCITVEQINKVECVFQ